MLHMLQLIFSFWISFCSIFNALHSFRIRLCFRLDFFPFIKTLRSSSSLYSMDYFVCLCARFRVIDTNEQGMQCIQVRTSCTYWLNLASFLNTKWIVKSLVTEPICISIQFMALSILVFLVLFHFPFVLYSMGHVSFSIIYCSSCVDCRWNGWDKGMYCGANYLENWKALSTFE